MSWSSSIFSAFVIGTCFLMIFFNSFVAFHARSTTQANVNQTVLHYFTRFSIWNVIARLRRAFKSLSLFVKVKCNCSGLKCLLTNLAPFLPSFEKSKLSQDLRKKISKRGKKFLSGEKKFLSGEKKFLTILFNRMLSNLGASRLGHWALYVL